MKKFTSIFQHLLPPPNIDVTTPNVLLHTFLSTCANGCTHFGFVLICYTKVGSHTAQCFATCFILGHPSKSVHTDLSYF